MPTDEARVEVRESGFLGLKILAVRKILDRQKEND
jgi:hypothetical protein